MKELRLRYHRLGKSKQHYYDIDWPSTKPLLWASIAPDPVMKLAKSVSRTFVAINLLPDHRIYFAAATEGNHDHVKSLLTSYGETFQETREMQGKKTVGHGLFRILTFGRRVPVEVSTLLASTRHGSVIDAVFEGYQFSWKIFFMFPFVIAKIEPSRWVEELTAFSKLGVRRKIGQDLIADSRSIILTQWDHGLDFVSNKVTRPELEHVAEKTASENNLRLSISEDANPAH